MIRSNAYTHVCTRSLSLMWENLEVEVPNWTVRYGKDGMFQMLSSLNAVKLEILIRMTIIHNQNFSRSTVHGIRIKYVYARVQSKRRARVEPIVCLHAGQTFTRRVTKNWNVIASQYEARLFSGVGNLFESRWKFTRLKADYWLNAVACAPFFVSARSCRQEG